MTPSIRVNMCVLIATCMAVITNVHFPSTKPAVGDTASMLPAMLPCWWPTGISRWPGNSFAPTTRDLLPAHRCTRRPTASRVTRLPLSCNIPHEWPQRGNTTNWQRSFPCRSTWEQGWSTQQRAQAYLEQRKIPMELAVATGVGYFPTTMLDTVCLL